MIVSCLERPLLCLYIIGQVPGALDLFTRVRVYLYFFLPCTVSCLDRVLIGLLAFLVRQLFRVGFVYGAWMGPVSALGLILIDGL